MKKTLFSGILLLFSIVAFAQTGWRKGEMEVFVTLNSPEQGQIFRETGIDAEQATPDGSVLYAYVVPSEYEMLLQKGFSCSISIPDLNSHYNGFWNAKVPSGYMTYEQIISLADSLSSHFPAICKKFVLGNSAGGRELGVLKISDNVNVDEAEPGILFDGGIHGDEVMGPEVVIRYARYLCLGYGSNPVYTDLINNREIWLYYMVNPDGRVNMSRYNNNNVDCNRDAGYMWNAEGNSTGAFSQPESKVLRDLMIRVNPVVYTNYHGGTEIISYPWSYRSSECPDNDHINNLAHIYSDSSGYTDLPYGQGYNIMYAINGSYKDFQYGSLGNVGWSIEITAEKQPPSSQISPYYNMNEPAITAVIQRCGDGIQGVVTDSLTGDPVLASIWVDGFYPVMTRQGVGDFHKYLLPGTYDLKVTASGYQARYFQNVNVPSNGSVSLDMLMKRDTGYYSRAVMSCRIPLMDFSGFTNAAYTPGISDTPDNNVYNLWKNGWIIIDMGDTIYNGPGNDFKVWEGGTDPEGFSCYAGSTKDGPWYLLGTGTGTSSFDISNASGGIINKARYLKITDDGDGQSSGTNLGYDLDAVSMITKPLIAMFTASDLTPCQHDAVTFRNYSAGTPDSYEWSFPGGYPSSSTAEDPVVEYHIPGTYQVRLKVSNSYCISIKTKKITVLPAPSVDLGNDTIILPTQTLTLHAGNAGCSYLWSTGDTTEWIIASATGAGEKNFWVNVINSDGCIATDTITITFSWPAGTSEKDGKKVTVAPNPADDHIIIRRNFSGGLHSVIYTAEGKMIKESVSERIETGDLEPGLYFIRIECGGEIFTCRFIVR